MDTVQKYIGYNILCSIYTCTCAGIEESESKDQQVSEMMEEVQAKLQELEVTKRISQAKTEKILKLEKELQVKQKGLGFLTEQFEQLKQQGKDRVSVANSQVKK